MHNPHIVGKCLAQTSQHSLVGGNFKNLSAVGWNVFIKCGYEIIQLSAVWVPMSIWWSRLKTDGLKKKKKHFILFLH